MIDHIVSDDFAMEIEAEFGTVDTILCDIGICNSVLAEFGTNDVISADFEAIDTISTEFDTDRAISVEIADEMELDVEIGVGGVIHIPPEDLEIYDGDTTIIPKANEQTVLPTAQKLVEDDITVMEIPFYQTTNPQGGNTIYIGRESEVI